ncbi:MAG: TlpA disulfide reductase family protein [Candidatus Margulisiibacteriota bacterium]|jgi:thiol-disulfide isomerase/thioredoxin
MLKRITLALLIIFTCTAVLCAMGDRIDRSKIKNAIAVAGNPAAADKGAMVFNDLDGNPVPVLDIIGQKAVILNFFASWCPPCREEMPSLDKLNQYIIDKDVILLAVNLQESPEHIKSFMEESGYTFRVVFDPQDILTKKFKISGIPTTYLIDKNGKVRKKIVGSIDWMDETMLKLVNEISR